MRRDKEGLLLIGKYFAKSHPFLDRPQFGLIGKGTGDGSRRYAAANTHFFLCIKPKPTLQFRGVGAEMVWIWRGVESRGSLVFLWDETKILPLRTHPKSLSRIKRVSGQGGTFFIEKNFEKKSLPPYGVLFAKGREPEGGSETHPQFYTTPRFKFINFPLYLRLI